MIAEKMLRLVVGVFVSALIARHLSPDGFGQLNYVLALLTIAVTVSTLGLNRIIVRKIVESINDITTQISLISTSIILRVGASLVIFILISTICIYFQFNNWLLYIVIFTSLLFSPLDVVDLYQQALSDVKMISIARFTVMILSSLLKLSFVFTDQPLQWFYFAVLFEYAVTAILLLLVFRIKHKRNIASFSSFSTLKAKECLSEGWPEIIAGFGAVLFMRLDQIMLNALVGSESVGIYSAAIRLSEAWYFIPSAIVAASFPFIISGKNYSKECYRQRLRGLLSILLIIAILAALLMSLISGWVVNLIYGVEYSESAVVLMIHCWAGVFVCMGIGSGSALAAEKKLKWNLYRNIFGLGVNIILNFILIDLYGAIGAAFATLISLACAFWLFDLLFKPLRYMFIEKFKAFNFFWLFDSAYLKRLTKGF